MILSFYFPLNAAAAAAAVTTKAILAQATLYVERCAGFKL